MDPAAPRQPPTSALDISRAFRAAAERYTGLLKDALGDNLVSVVLFGSVARGEARSDSDIDLLIVAEHLPFGRFARLRQLEEVERSFESELDRLRSLSLEPRVAPLLKTREEASRLVPVYLDLVQDARFLYDRDAFFRSVLARLETSLRRLGAERRTRGQIRYWVLKPDWKPGEVIEL